MLRTREGVETDGTPASAVWISDQLLFSRTHNSKDTHRAQEQANSQGSCLVSEDWEYVCVQPGWALPGPSLLKPETWGGETALLRE